MYSLYMLASVDLPLAGVLRVWATATSCSCFHSKRYLNEAVLTQRLN